VSFFQFDVKNQMPIVSNLLVDKKFATVDKLHLDKYPSVILFQQHNHKHLLEHISTNLIDFFSNKEKSQFQNRICLIDTCCILSNCFPARHNRFTIATISQIVKNKPYGMMYLRTSCIWF